MAGSWTGEEVLNYGLPITIASHSSTQYVFCHLSLSYATVKTRSSLFIIFHWRGYQSTQGRRGGLWWGQWPSNPVRILMRRAHGSHAAVFLRWLAFCACVFNGQLIQLRNDHCPLIYSLPRQLYIVGIFFYK